MTDTNATKMGSPRRGSNYPPTETAIRNALAAATSPLPDQTPAIEALVVLRGMTSAIAGALSETPDGGLRMLSKVGEENAHTASHVYHMVEQFFDYADVLTFGVQHIVAAAPAFPGRIFRGS